MGIHREYDFRKLAKISLYLQQPGMKFYVTNEDRIYSAGCHKGLGGQTRFVPDIGAALGAIEAASGVRADRMGKPHLHGFNAILRDHFADECSDSLRSSFLMIGDNMESDIQFAVNCGIDSCLVFTGVQKKPCNDLEYSLMVANICPTYIC